MKRICYITIVFVLLVGLLVGCEKNPVQEIQAENIAIGVIETRGNQDNSRILFFDDTMNELGSLKLNFATVGNIFYSPLVIDDMLYVIPQGDANKKDAETVLEIDLSDLSIKEYSIEQLAMNSVAVSETSVYTCNTLNGVSYINKCDKKSGAVDMIDIPLTYISKLLYVHDKLYAFGTTNTENDTMFSELFIYDDDLNLIEKIDISECGANQYKAVEHNGDVYFTSLTDEKDNPVSTIGIVNESDYAVKTIQLEQSNPLDLAIYEGKLYISHFDVIQLSGGGLSVYDIGTGNLEHYDFEHGAEQMSIASGRLYILSDWKIYVYDIESMELIQSTDIESMDDDFSYLSGLFVTGD